MKRLIILGAVWALAVAKPELYKESEDFKFSRSSSDDGSKSGYYGSQRGNMGGNYERAHNMDALAQNQMSGLVRQVEGELGNGAKMRSGSVYSAAKSRGTYGSGHFDLSNLAGRNFQEGTSYGDALDSALSASSASSVSSAYNNAGYANSHSQSSRYSGYQTAGLNTQSDDLQSLDNAQGSTQYDYGRQSSHSSGYRSQSGFQQQSAFDNTNTNAYTGGYGSNVHTRLISATPVRVILRPGSRVAVPVAAQTYDATHGSSINQNSLNSEAEVLNNDNQRTVYTPTNAKHYESSYNYRKSWEKHDTIPSAVVLPTSTENPFPKNSELYEDSQASTNNDQYDASRINSQRIHTDNTYGAYNNVKSASSQSRLNYETQHYGTASRANTNAYTLAGHSAGSSNQKASSDGTSNGYTQTQYNAGSRYNGAVADSNTLTQAGFNTDLNGQVENLNTKPKSYQSSYSYHKSWERQGDPYIIKPASSGYYNGQSSQRLTSTKNQGYAISGSHYQNSQQSVADCDENGNNLRIARSINQHSQNIEDLGQQVEDLSQQTQSNWDQQEAGQQTQNSWNNLEDLNQQSQNKWDKIEDLGQHSQNTWDKFQDFGQSNQNNWDQQDFGQQTQDTNAKIENLEQQNQNDLGQQIQDMEIEVGSKPQDVGQQIQDKWDFSNNGQQDLEKIYEQNQNHRLEGIDKFTQQENQAELNKPDNFKYLQSSQKEFDTNNSHQINIWDTSDNLGSHQRENQNIQQHIYQQNYNSRNNHFWEHFAHNTQQTYTDEQSDTGHFSMGTGYINSHTYNRRNQLEKVENNYRETHNFYGSNNWNTNLNSQTQNQATGSNSFSGVNKSETILPNTSHLSSLWDKLNNIEQQSAFSTETGYENVSEPNNISQNSYQNQDLQNQTEISSTYHHNYNKIKPHEEQMPLQPQLNKEVMDVINKSKELVPANAKERPQDIGRGDIDPDVLPDLVADNNLYRNHSETLISKKEIEYNNGNQNKPNKIGNEPSLAVSSLDQQKLQDEINIRNNSAPKINTLSTQEYLPNNKLHELHEQSKLNNSSEPPNQSTGTNDLKDIIKNVEHESSSFKQQNFSKHENKDQSNSQNFGQVDFGQQDNFEQNLQDFGQQNLQSVEHQNQQQNLHVFSLHDNLEQHNEQNLGKQDNLDQQNLHDFGQQENLDQHNLQDFAQQENLEQQNLHDFGQQENLEQQNLQNFGQRENLEQQNLQAFGYQENLEQQNLRDFAHQESLQQHHSHNIGQQENLEQENLRDFEQQENLEQHNLQDFGQQENMEQHNLHDFGQHENLEQQNLQDFGQQENLEQQNLEDLVQHDNLQQQNLKDFSQQENLEHQVIQDFRQHEDQRNLLNLGQQPADLIKHMNHEKPLHYLNQQSENNFGRENIGQTNLEHISSDKEEHTTHQKNNLQPQINPPHPEKIVEPEEVPKLNNDLKSIAPQSPKPEQIIPTEPVTEKPGFWKSVGNKLSRAKSKVASWFSS